MLLLAKLTAGLPLTVFIVLAVLVVVLLDIKTDNVLNSTATITLWVEPATGAAPPPPDEATTDETAIGLPVEATTTLWVEAAIDEATTAPPDEAATKEDATVPPNEEAATMAPVGALLVPSSARMQPDLSVKAAGHATWVKETVGLSVPISQSKRQ
jgi:hypothetical protein